MQQYVYTLPWLLTGILSYLLGSLDPIILAFSPKSRSQQPSTTQQHATESNRNFEALRTGPVMPRVDFKKLELARV